MISSNNQFAKSHLLFTIIRGLFSASEEEIKQSMKGFSVPGFRIIWILYFEEKMSMTDLAYIAQLNISSIYRQLLKLEDADFVIIKSGEDARIKEISLTPKGRIIIQDVINMNINSPEPKLPELTEIIPREELDTFFKVGTILCAKLLGQKYVDWAVKSANQITEEFK